MVNRFLTAGPNSKYKLPGAQAAGFLDGLWHGLIAPITFIIAMCNTNVRIYETNNTGRLYELGFVIGISTSFAGSSSKVRR
ncbi:hypothetical protein ACOAKC_12015 [Hathewaya histolytica]|uniref:hypothetical protein n=1 Tax=Hathewaya histolytica TaxID=1498 RepID=UPI003B684533